MFDHIMSLLDTIFSSSLFFSIWHYGAIAIIATSCLLSGLLYKNINSADITEIVGFGILIALFWPGIMLGVILVSPFWLIYQLGVFLSFTLGK